jgi:DNA-binding NtrC family response regulator
MTNSAFVTCLSEILNDEGHSVDLAENATQARAARAAGMYDLVLLDIWMPDTDGVSLLKEWASAGVLTMPVIMMSGHATIDTAVEATRIGAFSFLEKPITLQKLLKAVEQGLARTAVQQAPVVAPSPPLQGLWMAASCPHRSSPPPWWARSALTRTKGSIWIAPCVKPATALKKPTLNSISRVKAAR